MDYHFAQRFFIGYSDVDRNNNLRLSRLLDLLQNTATIHSKSLGYGTFEMMELGLGWLALAWKIKILKYPKADTYIEVRTWSKSGRGLHAYRDYEIVDEDGNTMILVASSWVLYDLKAQKPIKSLPEMKYGVIDRDALEEPISRTLSEDVDDGNKAEIIIGKRDIDTNGHVNNAKYMEYFMEVTPDNFEAKDIEIHYKRQTMFGEKIIALFDGSTCVMKNEDGEVKVVIMNILIYL